MRTGRRDRWSSRSAGAYVALGRWQTNGAGARDRSAGGARLLLESVRLGLIWTVQAAV